jgi:hypothetical protein
MYGESSSSAKTSIKRLLDTEVTTKVAKKTASDTSRIEQVIASWNISTFKWPKDEDKGANGVLLMSDVSKDEWNIFLQKDHALAGMLWHDDSDNKVYVIEVPSMPHESAIIAVHDAFTNMTKRRTLKACLANRWVGDDAKGREADASYRPFLGAVTLPPGVEVEDFVTLIVEVGYSQTLNGARGLRPKALEWLAQYPSVIYVILVHVSKKMTSLKAELWERGAANPIQQVDFSHAITGGCALTLNTRKILGIAAGGAILHDHPAVTTVDLDHVRLCIQESGYEPPEDD